MMLQKDVKESMRDCKSITIRFKEDEVLYKQFIQAKAKLDVKREDSGERKISCTDFTKKLLRMALKEEGVSEESKEDREKDREKEEK